MSFSLALFFVYVIAFYTLLSKILILFFTKRAVSHDVTHLARKKWQIKSCNLCWKVIGRIPTLGVILKTNKKLDKKWNKLLLISYLETKKFNQKRFG